MNNDERLDYNGYVPLYKQIFEILQKRIKEGIYTNGSQLPSERELIETFNVSRITATSAIQELVKNGLAYSKKGKGTFVTRPRIVGLSSFRSFSSDILQRGMTPSSRILSLQTIPADDNLKEILDLEPGDLCLQLSRVRLANNEPVALETTYLPEKRFPGFSLEDIEGKSLFSVFIQKYGFHPSWSDGIFEAASSTPEQASFLNLEPGAPVLQIRRVTMDKDSIPLEWANSIYRADTFSFSTGRQPIEV